MADDQSTPPAPDPTPPAPSQPAPQPPPPPPPPVDFGQQDAVKGRIDPPANFGEQLHTRSDDGDLLKR